MARIPRDIVAQLLQMEVRERTRQAVWRIVSRYVTPPLRRRGVDFIDAHDRVIGRSGDAYTHLVHSRALADDGPDEAARESGRRVLNEVRALTSMYDDVFCAYGSKSLHVSVDVLATVAVILNWKAELAVLRAACASPEADGTMDVYGSIHCDDTVSKTFCRHAIVYMYRGAAYVVLTDNQGDVDTKRLAQIATCIRAAARAPCDWSALSIHVLVASSGMHRDARGVHAALLLGRDLRSRVCKAPQNFVEACQHGDADAA